MLTEIQKVVVRQHLAKLIASSEFARSERAAAILKFVVLHTLDREGQPPKERTIGVAVFGRAQNWDPKLDTTVRTEARRVRKKLEDYYASAAAEGETVRIDIPVGGYAPAFTFRESAKPALERDVAYGSTQSLRAPSRDGALLASPQDSQSSQRIKPPVGRSNRYRWALPLAILCLVGLAIVGLTNRLQTSAHSQGFETIPITSEYGQAMHPSISPDAKQVAYVWDRGSGTNRIYLQSVAGGTPRRFTSGDQTELDPAWSPQGEKIAFLRIHETSTDVIVREIANGKEVMLGSITTQLGDWTGAPGPLLGELGPAWFPDENSVVVSDGFPHSPITGLVKIRLADGSRQQLTSTQGSIEDFLPKVSPDGRTIAFARAISHGISDLYLLDDKTGQVRQITKDAHSVNGIAWSKDGKSIVFSSNRQGPYQLWKVSLVDGSVERIDTNSTNAIDPQIAENAGWIAFVTKNENWNIERLSLKRDDILSQQPERFIASSGRNHSAQFSPDGHHIAFVSDRSGSWEIWLCDRTCSEPRKLTDFRGPWLGGLSWSPDSAELAFDARVGRNSAIYHMAISAPSPQIFERNSFEERMPVWSNDGKSIYFNSDRDGTISIWKRGLGNGTLRKIGLGFVAREINEQGDLLIGHSDGTIWSIQSSDLSEVRLPEDVKAEPVLGWTVHDGQLYYCFGGNTASIGVFNPATRKFRPLASVAGSLPQTSASLTVSADGQDLLITSVDHSDGNIYRRVGSF